MGLLHSHSSIKASYRVKPDVSRTVNILLSWGRAPEKGKVGKVSKYFEQMLKYVVFCDCKQITYVLLVLRLNPKIAGNNPLQPKLRIVVKIK